ncbi:MAG: DUF4258 domain-containing protein [Candidatus Ranarchaeia archaeon]
MSNSHIRFTKHALDKFNILQRYGFILERNQVIDVVANPDRLEHIGLQEFATKVLNEEYAIRVVYEKRQNQMVVITFYPVRRDRYGI